MINLETEQPVLILKRIKSINYFNFCKENFKRSGNDTDLKDMMFKEIINIAKYCNQYDFALDITEYDSGTEKIILFKLLNLTKSFERCKRIFNYLNQNDELKRIAFDKMVKFAKSYRNWRFIYKNAGDNEDLKAKALNEMSKFAKTFNEWRFIYYESFDNNLIDFALSQMAKYASNFKQNNFVYIELPIESALRSEFFIRVVEGATNGFQTRIASKIIKEFQL